MTPKLILVSVNYKGMAISAFVEGFMKDGKGYVAHDTIKAMLVLLGCGDGCTYTLGG